MRIFGLIVCIALCVFLIAPAAYARRDEPTPKFPGSDVTQPPAAKLGFRGGSPCVCGGIWDTNWGKMELSYYSDGRVVGTYTHDEGKIEGTISGHSFSGSWSEAPTYQGSNDAGLVELEFSEDCLSFTGRWKYGTTGGWYENGWTGKKIQGAPKLLGPD